MNINSILDYLRKTDQAGGRTGSEYDKWLDGVDIPQFLDASSRSDLIPIYIGSPGYFLHSLFVPSNNLKGIPLSYFGSWSLNMEERAFAFSLIGSRGNFEVDVAGPYHDEFEQVFKSADPLYFQRTFERRGDDSSTNFEFSQRLIHASEAHWVERQSAYCELDEQGNYIDLFKRIEVDDIEIVFGSREKLNIYGRLTNQTLLRLFEVIRNRSGYSGSEEKNRKRAQLTEENLYIDRLRIDWAGGERTSQLRGGQVLGNDLSREDAIKILSGERGEKKYAEFIAYDWKNKSVREISCAPNALANYFVKSDLPFETTPAFFRPEVLSRYKSDPAKYELHQRQIRCIGGWLLRTYDVNEEGQVHTYLCYLRNLPYSEQLYWKAFNEAPKGSISERALKTDFQGEWWDGKDPLEELKNTLRSFPLVSLGDKKVAIYGPGTDNFEAKLRELHYVTGDSVGEWKAQVINLASLCIDSLSKAGLKKVADFWGVATDGLGSIKLLEESLRATEIGEHGVLEIVSPLHEVWGIRSREGIAHMGNVPKNLRYADRFRKLVNDTAKGMHLLCEQISKDLFKVRTSK